mgnify:CR=1 FL=1
MVNNKNILAFLNYNYTPFSKAQCIKRALMVWAASTALCLVNQPLKLWIEPMAITNVIVSMLFTALVAKFSQTQFARYLCDGIFYLYMAVLLNLASYRVMTVQIGSNWLLAIILIGMLAICIFVYLLITLSNIKSGKFLKENYSGAGASLPIICGGAGILAARALLQGQSQNVVLTVIACVLLILSFIMGIPSINILKVVLYRRYVGK